MIWRPYKRIAELEAQLQALEKRTASERDWWQRHIEYHRTSALEWYKALMSQQKGCVRLRKALDRALGKHTPPAEREGR